MGMPGRKFAANGTYRYGFNGKENDDEIKGGGNSIDFGGRMYDPRVGRWFSVDSKERSYVSPYDYTSNNPTNRIDPDGNDDIHFYFKTTATYTKVGDPSRPASCSTHVSYRTTASVEIVKNNGPDKFYHHKQFAKAYTNGGNFSPANGTLVSDKVTELQPFSGGKNGFTSSSVAGWPLGFITVADYDNTTLQKYMYNAPGLVNYIKDRGLTGNTATDNGWETVLKYYKINGILDKAMVLTATIADVAGEARLLMKSGFGDLTIGEINQIQRVVNEAGRPLEVVGSTASGTRRGVGSNLPLGKGAGTKSDIDYLATPNSLEYYMDVQHKLPGIDPKTGVNPGAANPYQGASIRFEPGAIKPTVTPPIKN
jgi:RHS repeat-associated protein